MYQRDTSSSASRNHNPVVSVVQGVECSPPKRVVKSINGRGSELKIRFPFKDSQDAETAWISFEKEWNV